MVIDDRALFEQVRDYVMAVSPELADRVEYYDAAAEGLPIFERYHVHEQLHKALDRKVWLRSGGYLVIQSDRGPDRGGRQHRKIHEGKKSQSETIFKTNAEAAVEVARQLRLRDIGGIIVIDFIDMEEREKSRQGDVSLALQEAIRKDKAKTNILDFTELGLVEMTRKRVSEGLLETLSTECTVCGGRGVTLDDSVLALVR